MAEIVGIWAASHTPVMLNFPDAIPAGRRATIEAAFERLGRSVKAAAPEVLITISDDHLHNFFLDNLPAFCIGATNRYPTPVEHWLKADKRVLEGDSSLGAHLVGEALQAGFDPAFSMELTLDHGVLTPLIMAGIEVDFPLVPLLVNCVQPPLPTMARALQWGRFLGGAVAAYGGCRRVGILATGGISHDVATPRMGGLNEAFDREFLRLLAAGDDEALVAFSRDHVHEAGNGGEEIRTWLVAHGAAGGASFETLLYQGEPDWYTGIGIAQWNMAGRGRSESA